MGRPSVVSRLWDCCTLRRDLKLSAIFFPPFNSLGTRTICIKILGKNLKGFYRIVQAKDKGYEQLTISDQYLGIFDKKLSYRKQITRKLRTQYVEGI